ncbi:MAG TPA: VOC family protein [Thermoanaerobaculia bacterium]|nr:VOC family protein [Thermoanaerobaculia bacterium]
MPHVTSHPPGSFCWVELGTTDVNAARTFYTQLFGWTVNEIPMGEFGVYTIFQKDGRDCAAGYELMSNQPGVPPNWLSYVAVADTDAAVGKAKGLGAAVVSEPMDVFDSGRMAVLADPQGAVFAVWQAKEHIGVQIRDEPDTLCWNELQVRDLEAAKKFYPALFPWRMKESPEYTEWHLGENAVGGMIVSQWPPEVPSVWLPYFAVTDCEGTVAKSGSLGGSTIVPPMEIANVGRMAVLSDPQGAVFAVIRLAL